MSDFWEAHIKDGKVEEYEYELQADAQQALQLAHYGARVFQRVGQVASVVIDLQDRLLHVLHVKLHSSQTW